MLMQRLAEEFPGEARAEVQAALERLELRPVFTAHPTESSRQSVLRVLRRVGEALDRGRTTRRSRALVDLLWQTDEIRPGKPTVADEARNAIGWYLEQLARSTVPELVGEFEREARAARASPCPTTPARWCWARGSAATATATRSSPPR